MKVTKVMKKPPIEYCPECGKIILDTNHENHCYRDCIEDELALEENYADRLAYGFDLVNMED